MSEANKQSILEKFIKSFGLIILGVILDVADLATFGAWGLYLGAMVGGLLGLYLAYAMNWGWKGQCLMVLFGGAYLHVAGHRIDSCGHFRICLCSVFFKE